MRSRWSSLKTDGVPALQLVIIPQERANQRTGAQHLDVLVPRVMGDTVQVKAVQTGGEHHPVGWLVELLLEGDQGARE